VKTFDEWSNGKKHIDENESTKLLTKELFRLSLPTMLGFAIQSLYDIVDMFWIGKISYKAIAGIVIFSTIFWLVEILNEIIGTSSVSLISQAYGKGNLKLTSLIIEQTLIFKAIVSFFSSDTDVINSAIHYGYIRIFFMPAFFMTYSTFTALRNIGRASLATLTMATGTIVNIVLDPIFIFEKIPFLNITGFGLGVSGAAWATVISTFIPLVWGLYLLFRGIEGVKISIRGLLSLDKKIDTKLITIGLPSGVEMLLRNLSYTVLIKISSLFGSEYVTVFGIIERMFGFAVIPIFGLSMGASTLVGFQLGKNNEKGAKKATILATFYSVIIVSLLLVPLLLFHIKRKRNRNWCKKHSIRYLCVIYDILQRRTFQCILWFGKDINSHDSGDFKSMGCYGSIRFDFHICAPFRTYRTVAGVSCNGIC
jgi:putative MATE family efflux protein